MIKLGNIIWAELHRSNYGFRRGYDLRVTLLPKGRDEGGDLIAGYDKTLRIGL